MDMAATSEVFVTIFWSVLAMVVAGLLFLGPFHLYKRYRARYADGPAFRVEWTEQVAEGAFRGGDQSFEQQVRVTPSGEWAAKIGFFLGILGFLWTPLVLLGALSGDLRPMVTVGLPGLVVSWSTFFAARAMLKHGPRAAPLMRFAGVSEIVQNVWVLAVIVLSTLYKEHALSEENKHLVEWLFLASGRGSTSGGMGAYTLVYGLQELGVITLAYASFSFLHARLMLKAWSSMEAARQVQLRAEQVTLSAA